MGPQYIKRHIIRWIGGNMGLRIAKINGKLVIATIQEGQPCLASLESDTECDPRDFIIDCVSALLEALHEPVLDIQALPTEQSSDDDPTDL